MKLKATLVPMLAFAALAQPAQAGVYTSPTVITRITADPYLVMFMAPTANANDGCNGSDQYVLLKSHANYEALHSILLTAFSTGKTVAFWIEGCHDVGGGYTYPKIYQVFLYS